MASLTPSGALAMARAYKAVDVDHHILEPLDLWDGHKSGANVLRKPDA